MTAETPNPMNQPLSLREALEFYADPLSWTRSQMVFGDAEMEGDSPAECDRGGIAREALASLSGGEPETVGARAVKESLNTATAPTETWTDGTTRIAPAIPSGDVRKMLGVRVEELLDQLVSMYGDEPVVRHGTPFYRSACNAFVDLFQAQLTEKDRELEDLKADFDETVNKGLELSVNYADAQAKIDAQDRRIAELEMAYYNRRWNIEEDGQDLLICRGEHKKHEACQYVRYIAASPQGEAWQPIETAPKDGTEVDLWMPWGARVECAKWLRGAWCTEQAGSWAGEIRYGWEPLELEPNEHPTHWMPLPKPPSGDTQKGGAE